MYVNVLILHTGIAAYEPFAVQCPNGLCSELARERRERERESGVGGSWREERG